MALAAGRLNRRVWIQSVVRTPDGGGGFTETWQNDARVWAGIQTLTGQERWDAQQIAAGLSHRVTIRKRPISPHQRILHGSRILKIQAVMDPDEGGEYLLLDCIEEDIQ